MAHRTDSNTTERRNPESIGVNTLGAERRKSARRVSLEQEKADFDAWLREYRRWTQRGCGPGARAGEIEWGGEDGTSH